MQKAANAIKTLPIDVKDTADDWATAMALPSDCNSGSCASQIAEKHQGICPDGFHIPTNADWDKLVRYVGNSGTAGKYLKTIGWWGFSSSYGRPGSENNGTDSYGFAALGSGRFDSGFFRYIYISSEGFWWSASEGAEGDSIGAYSRHLQDAFDNVGDPLEAKRDLLSVRCLQD